MGWGQGKEMGTRGDEGHRRKGEREVTEQEAMGCKRGSMVVAKRVG